MKAIAMGLLAWTMWAQGGTAKSRHCPSTTYDPKTEVCGLRHDAFGEVGYSYLVLPRVAKIQSIGSLVKITNNDGDIYYYSTAGIDGIKDVSDPAPIYCDVTVLAEPRDYECIPYIDETGQRVGVLTRKPKAKPVGPTKVIGSTGGVGYIDETVSSPGFISIPNDEPPYLSLRRVDGDEYLRIELNPDYSIKTATFRLPTSTVALTGEQLTQAVQAWVARRNEKLNESGWERGTADLWSVPTRGKSGICSFTGPDGGVLTWAAEPDGSCASPFIK